MQTESYVVLRPFMVEELGLKGSELVAYALIYGFSQDGESWFTGSAQYVADRADPVKSDASCTAPVGEAYVGAAKRSPRERIIRDYMNATGKGGFPSPCCAHYDRCVQNGVPECVEADRLTKEWVAAGGTGRQFPRSRYPWNPRP